MRLLKRLLLILVAIFTVSTFILPDIPDAFAKAKTRKSTKKRKKKRRYRAPSWPIPVPRNQETQSAGTPNHGRLYNPSKVPFDGKTLAVRKSTWGRNTNYGNRALVETLQYAADVVASIDPKARLFIGDASSERGGRLGSHKSHQNGLDVDIAFYVRDQNGNLGDTGTFVKLNRNGVSYDGKWRLDADLSWAFVEALLTSPKADVQYLFVYNPLKEMILEAGRRANANPAVLERASYVMQQPRDSSPHADHFHLRIYCPPGDRDDACMAHGIIWPWVQGIEPTKFAHVATYATGGKLTLEWAVDGTSLIDCDEPGEDLLSGAGAPLDGDFICVDPAEYADAFFEVEEEIEEGDEEDEEIDD